MVNIYLQILYYVKTGLCHQLAHYDNAYSISTEELKELDIDGDGTVTLEGTITLDNITDTFFCRVNTME